MEAERLNKQINSNMSFETWRSPSNRRLRRKVVRAPKPVSPASYEIMAACHRKVNQNIISSFVPFIPRKPVPSARLLSSAVVTRGHARLAGAGPPSPVAPPGPPSPSSPPASPRRLGLQPEHADPERIQLHPSTGESRSTPSPSTAPANPTPARASRAEQDPGPPRAPRFEEGGDSGQF
jgi:hypothetical protein